MDRPAILEIFEKTSNPFDPRRIIGVKLLLSKQVNFNLNKSLCWQFLEGKMVIQMMRAIRAASIGNRPIGRSSFSSSTTRLLSTITPPAQFYVPKSERTLERPAFQIDYMVGETRLARNSRTCPTRDLNFTNVQWGRHKSPYRKWRHMINLFRAAPFQRLLFPDLACIAGLSASLTFFNEFLVTGQDALTMISISPATFAGATTAISILAGFRLNASYGRYREGRQYWSVVNTATRDLARQSYLWIANPNINTTNSELTQAQIRMLRLCQAFPVALLFHVNDKGGHHNMRRRSKAGEAPFKDRVLAEFRAELEDVYYYTKHDDDTNAMLQEDLECIIRIKAQGGNAPLEIITCMGDIIGQCSRHSENPVHPVYIHQLDCQVQQLCKALGSCERIVKTPLPTGYSRHSSRLLFIWSHSLPFALYPLMGPWATLPTSLLTAYAVLGIEDISVQFEDPFDILPLRQYSDQIFDSIQAIEEGFANRTKHNPNTMKVEE